MRQRKCKVCDGWHDLDQPWPHNCLPEAPQRSHLAAPMIATGSREAFMSHADGRMYSCTRTYEREVVARGYEVVGNEALRPPRKAESPPGLKETLQRVAEEHGL